MITVFKIFILNRKFFNKKIFMKKTKKNYNIYKYYKINLANNLIF